MSIKSSCVAVFPVDEDFLQLPDNNEIFINGEKNKISYYLTLAGWNISNSDYVIDIMDRFDFRKISMLVLVNSYRFLESKVIEEILDIAVRHGIKIYCVRDDQDIDRKALEIQAKNLGVNIAFADNIVIPDRNNELNMIEVPIISISGTGPYVQKYVLGCKIKKLFEQDGYKVLYISSRKEGMIFGSSTYPDFIYENGISYSEKIYGLNHYIESLYKDIRPDVILLGVPGEMMELGPRHRMEFGYMPSVVFSAIKPDISIVNLYNLEYTDEFLDEQKKYCRYRFGISPDFFYISTTGLLESSLQDAWMQFYKSDQVYDNHLHNNTLFNSNDVDKGKLYEKIIETLKEYSILDFM